MSITSAKLFIDNVEKDLNAENIRFNSVIPWRRDQISTFNFTVESVHPIAIDPWPNKYCDLEIDNELVFAGRLTRRVNNVNEQTGWSYGYEAAGLETAVSQWPVVSPFDGTGTITFNLTPRDAGYDPTYAGLSIKDMIVLLLEEPSTANWLNNNRVGAYTTDANGRLRLPAKTINDLSNSYHLSQFKPTKSVTFSGDDLLQTMRAAIQGMAPTFTMWFEYARVNNQSHAYFRFADLLTINTNLPMAFDVDPSPDLQRDYSRAFPRVVVRGGVNVQPMMLSLKKGELSEDFSFPPWFTTTAAAKANWTLSTWTDQKGRKYNGRLWCRRPRSASNPNEIDPTIPDPNNPNQTISNPNYIADVLDSQLASPYWALFDPEDPLVTTPATPQPTWNATVWGQNATQYGGSLFLERYNGNNTLWKETVIRSIVDNTNLTSGGRSYLQLAEALPATDYSNGTLVATRWPGLQTYRKYKINAKMFDGTSVAKRVQATFPAPVSWVFPDGSQTSCLTCGIAQIIYTANGTTANASSAYLSFQVDRETETIIFDRPVVTVFGSRTALQTGGSSVDGIPTDIQVLLPVAIAPLEAVYPQNVNGNASYAGTSNTVDGVLRTKYVQNPDFKSTIDQSMMNLWAQQIHQSICDTVVEGTCEKYAFVHIKGPGTRITWSDSCYSNGTWLNQLTSTCRGSIVRWNHGGPVTVATVLEVSNRLEPYSDDAHLVYHAVQYPNPTMPTSMLDVRSAFGGQEMGDIYVGAREAMSDAALNPRDVITQINDTQTGLLKDLELSAIERILNNQATGEGNWSNDAARLQMGGMDVGDYPPDFGT